eukprot:UN28425
MDQVTKNLSDLTPADVKNYAEDLRKAAAEKANMLTNSSYFKNLVKQVFETIDMDKSSKVDFQEMYIGILLLYVSLTRVIPGGAIPPAVDDVKKLMNKVAPNHESVDLEEFEALCKVLLQNITGRVITQAIFAFLVFPILATLFVWIYSFFNPLPYLLTFFWPEGLAASII